MIVATKTNRFTLLPGLFFFPFLKFIWSFSASPFTFASVLLHTTYQERLRDMARRSLDNLL
jgi:hypothetical protein